MKNQNSIKKKSHNFNFPHPLLKNIQQTAIITKDVDFNRDYIPQIYSNYLFDQESRSEVSTKLLRISNKKVLSEQKFGIHLQPFNNSQNVRTHYQDNYNLQCQICSAFLNCKTKNDSIYQIRCNICKQSQQVKGQVIQKKNEMGAFCDIYKGQKIQNMGEQNFIVKNVCFVIQASQQNYQNQIHDILIACLNAIKQQTQQEKQNISQRQNDMFFLNNLKVKFNIAFILFDNKNVYLVNQYQNNVLVFQQNFLNIDAKQIHNIIDFNNFFIPVQNVTEDTFQLIKSFLYEAYMIKHTCLQFAVNFIQKAVDNFQNQVMQPQTKQKNKKIIQFKFFITNISSTSNSAFSNEKQLLFKDISNTNKLNSKQNKIVKSEGKQTQTKSSLKLHSNHEYFIVKHKFQSREYLQKLKSRVYRIYQCSPCKTLLFNQIYYDLYQNLKQKENYFDVQLKIITSPEVKLISVGNSSFGYEECSPVKIKQNTKRIYNEYSTIFKNLKSNSTIPIMAKIQQNNSLIKKKNTMYQSNHPIQFQFVYTINISASKPKQFTRVFNCQVRQIQNHSYKNSQSIIQNSTNSSGIDDQTFFYVQKLEIMEECQKTKTNHMITNKMTEKIKQFSINAKKIYGKNLQFEKQLRHTYLYAFMIQNRSYANIKDINFHYSRHLLLFSSMQEKIKQFYPRVYQIKQQISQVSNSCSSKYTGNLSIKNVKCCQSKFKANDITLFQNGLYLYLVVGEDCSVEFLKMLFNTYILRQIYFFNELPELESNIRYRQAIQKIRNLNQGCYLRLRIIQLFSPQFQTQIGPFLYSKEGHYSYMKKLYKN